MHTRADGNIPTVSVTFTCRGRIPAWHRNAGQEGQSGCSLGAFLACWPQAVLQRPPTLSGHTLRRCVAHHGWNETQQWSPTHVSDDREAARACQVLTVVYPDVGPSPPAPLPAAPRRTFRGRRGEVHPHSLSLLVPSTGEDKGASPSMQIPPFCATIPPVHTRRTSAPDAQARIATTLKNLPAKPGGVYIKRLDGQGDLCGQGDQPAQPRSVVRPRPAVTPPAIPSPAGK